MKNKTVELAPMIAEPSTSSRAFAFVAPLAMLAVAATAGAQETGLTFDTSGLQSQVTTILGVGVAIAIMFALYKLGKRAMNRM